MSIDASGFDSLQDSYSVEIQDAAIYDQEGREEDFDENTSKKTTSVARTRIQPVYRPAANRVGPQVILCSDNRDYERRDTRDGKWSGECNVSGNVDSEGKKSASVEVRESYQNSKSGNEVSLQGSMNVDDNGKVSGSVGVGGRW